MIDMIDIQFSKFNFHRFSQEENSKNHLFQLLHRKLHSTLQNEKLYFTRDAINNSLFKISNFTVSRKKNLRRTLPKSCSIASIKKKRYKHHQKRFSKILIPARLVDIPSYFQKSNLC